MQNKRTGSYYTPKILSDFLVQHIFDKYVFSENVSVLEPSCGDGIFVSALSNFTAKRLDLDILDINKEELSKAKKLISKNNKIKFKAHHQDYLDFFLNNDNKYSLVIGNPPYIKKNNMVDEQIQRCEKIHDRIVTRINGKKSKEKIKNIWPAFVEAAIMSLNETGVLCFVIPAEILQVIYAKNLRTLIMGEFDRVEVFAFNELIFEGIQQDVVALIGIKGIENINEHGFSFYQVEALDDLKEPRFTEKNNNVHRTTLDKWTNYILTDEELNFIDEHKNNYQSIKNYCDKAEVGIVSAANDYFILSDSDVLENKLNRLNNIVKPILPKGYTIPDIASFTLNDLNQLRATNKRVNFLHFPDLTKNKLGKIANDYLKKGEEEKLHERYKMTKRKNWYHVPSIWKSEGLFVKRCHMYPKFFVNEADTLATDSFYRVITKDEFNIKKLVFSFYNSLTFVLAELEGRFYGGGVLELTPNEFKNLSIPYSEDITDEQFNILDQMLRNQVDIEEILEFTNTVVLQNINTIQLEEIRKKLVLRRLKREEKFKLNMSFVPIKPKKKIKQDTRLYKRDKTPKFQQSKFVD